MGFGRQAARRSGGAVHLIFHDGPRSGGWTLWLGQSLPNESTSIGDNEIRRQGSSSNSGTRSAIEALTATDRHPSTESLLVGARTKPADAHAFTISKHRQRLHRDRQVARKLVKGKGLAQLLSRPFRGRVGGHIEVQNTTPIMGPYQKHVKPGSGWWAQ
jgi:hypothetical protein